jgi:hypothetical protein
MQALKTIWRAADRPCGKLLRKAIPLFLPKYEKHHGGLAPEVLDKLQRVSAATIDRVLEPTRRHCGKGKGLTKPGSLLREEIPLYDGYWDTTVPGFVEADTVAHCGNSSKGPFIFSVTLTDIATQWTESRAVWTKLAENVVEAIKDIETCMPFPMLGFDCDNGSEFLNDHLVRYFQRKKIPLTRSRPYRKNDNAHVEQKNWMNARQLLGYARLDNPDLVPIINDLYRIEWSRFRNFFCPTMKLKEKVRVGSRYRRKYDEPKTPFQRVLESELVVEKKKQELKLLFESLDPFELKKEILRKQQIIRKLQRTTFDEWQLLQMPSFPVEQ